MDKNTITGVLHKSPNRRGLLKTLGMASAAVTAGGLNMKAAPSGPSAVDVLQFALNLEYLEAEFYTMAVYGKHIDDPQFGIGISGSGNQGATTGGAKVNFANNLVFTGQVAAEIGADERAHVKLLRTALQNAGIMPVAKPTINLDALGIGFVNEGSFLLLARIFEDIGVTAYGGATTVAAFATSPYLSTGARILATEAEHVGSIRLQVARFGIATAPPLDSVDFLPPPSGPNYISANPTTGLTSIRTPGQVLYLAYGKTANSNSGGFFPDGVNGNIRTSDTAA